jgi:hypothetical protein
MDTAVYTNKEIPRDQQTTGQAYVSAVMPSEAGKPTKILIAADGMCGHQNRICTECAHEWQQDYQLLFQQTAGGRRLRDRLGA